MNHLLFLVFQVTFKFVTHKLKHKKDICIPWNAWTPMKHLLVVVGHFKNIAFTLLPI